MAYFERMRDIVSQPFSPDVIRQRTTAGWQMVAIEWKRELPDAEAPTTNEFNEDVPYGLRVSDDCRRLEADPVEHQVLMLIMDLLVEDFSYAEIVTSLNEKGFRMRNGQPWNRVAVFRMIPRLIEVGPNFFSSGEWAEHRHRIEHQQAEAHPQIDAMDRPVKQQQHAWKNLFGRRPRD